MALEETLREHGIVKNAWGFYEVQDKPDARNLSEYYEKKYYQQGQGHYDASYSEAERRYYLDKVRLKALALEELAPPESNDAPRSLLDVGCGEGFTLEYFRREGWSVLGLDYSDHGCGSHNPACLPLMQKGDLYQNLSALVASERKFDVVWLDNVLEHVLDPLSLLRSLRGLTTRGGLLVVEVPNDFSALQLSALDSGRVARPFWIALPDHLSYFNRDGLVALCRDAGFTQRRVLADYWIDFNLFNERTNYVEDRSAGKACHQARMAAETLMIDISPQKTNALYEALAALGLGRQIVGFFS